MSEQSTGRRRARSELSPHSRPNLESSPRPRASAESRPADHEDIRSPRRGRAGTTVSQHHRPHEQDITLAGLRRRATAVSRVSRPSDRPASTTSARPAFTTAGLDDSSQIRSAHENFVAPGYAELNPSYVQPASAQPVWSLAKPLPRVVRPGMVPTQSEIHDVVAKPEAPAEHSHKLGLDVDPSDLEKGKVQVTADPRKISAQLKDSREQREHNFLASLARRGTLSGISGGPSGLSLVDSRTSQPPVGGRRRGSTLASVSRPPPAVTSAWPELEEDEDIDGKEDDPAHEDVQGARKSQDSSRTQHDDHQFQPISSLDPIPEGGETRAASIVSSIATLQDEPLENRLGHDGTEERLEDILPDVEPLIQQLIDDEIHNNHNWWSVIRTKYRESFAELFAIYVMLVIGFSADLSVTLAQTANPSAVPWAWGLATMIGIYIAGGVSGAHLNPVVTIILWIFRGSPSKKTIPFVLAQFLGAFLAAYTAYGIFRGSIHAYLVTQPQSSIIDSFLCNPRNAHVDEVSAFFNDFVGSAFLAATIVALGDDKNSPATSGMNAFIIGLVSVALSIAFSFQTGAALNPARDFTARVALYSLGYRDRVFTDIYWLYGPWGGAVGGGIIGVLCYDLLIFTGGESPVNYPSSRIKRSYIKSKRNAKRRLRFFKRNKAPKVVGA